MIDLTNKAAKRFHINWKDLEERSGDFLKVDAVMIDRVPVLFIVHKYTLFTLVRRKSQFRDSLAIANDVIKSCPWYRSPQAVCQKTRNAVPRLIAFRISRKTALR